MSDNSLMTNGDLRSSQSDTPTCKCCGCALHVFEQPGILRTYTEAHCLNETCNLYYITLEIDVLAALTDEQIEQYAAMNAWRRFRDAGQAARASVEIKVTW